MRYRFWWRGKVGRVSAGGDVEAALFALEFHIATTFVSQAEEYFGKNVL